MVGYFFLQEEFIYTNINSGFYLHICTTTHQHIMKVSGFTFVRNAVKFDYPIVEAIQSILPLCDEFIVAVGNSEDDSLGLIRSIPSPKIKS